MSDNVLDKKNKFSIYLGIVLEDKFPNDEMLKVHVLDFNPFVDGKVEIKSDTVLVGDDVNGTTESVEISNTIIATYFSLITNRAYPPDVKKNEQVLVFRIDGTDKYYWYPLGRDDYLRRTERVTLRASNNLKVPKGLSDNNSYTLELDTKYKGHILLKTSKSGGEQYQYQIKIDTQKNMINICDDDNNQIVLDSSNKRVLMSNSERATVDIVNKNISIIAPEDIIVKCGRQLVLDSPVIYSKNTDKYGSTEFKGNNLSLKLNKSIVIDAPCIGLNGSVIADNVVAKHMLSSGYSTGKVNISRGNDAPQVMRMFASPMARAFSISAYIGTAVDLISGSGTNPNNVPLSSISNDDNRYCAAWGDKAGEDGIKKALDKVCEALELLATPTTTTKSASSISSLVAEIKDLANRAKMQYNRGE